MITSVSLRVTCDREGCSEAAHLDLLQAEVVDVADAINAALLKVRWVVRNGKTYCYEGHAPAGEAPELVDVERKALR